MSRDVVIVEAVRTPIGRRNGTLSTVHPADLLGLVQRACLERAGVEPGRVDQVVGGCISQFGEQAANVTRRAWLANGFPVEVAATTVDSQCGSSQQAASLAASLIGSGATDLVMACGVESMSRVPLGSSIGDREQLCPPSYLERFELTSQFEGAERIATHWGITRSECDELGLASQERAQAAWAEGRFDEQVVPVDTVDTRVTRDEGLRETSLAALAGLTPVARPDGVHTAGTSSQIADGASAVLLASAARAAELGLRPRARIVDHCLVGSDPVLMLTGPIPATRKLLSRAGLTIDDVDVFEINEAFAAVVLAWQQDLGPDPDRVNPNGGAIAVGHPLGATGTILLTKALYELERVDGTTALVTMCCGGGLGTGTLIERT
jgi:acetyl-CoA C-acetyltransferase